MEFHSKCATCGATTHLSVECWAEMESTPKTVCGSVQSTDSADGWKTVKKPQRVKKQQVEDTPCCDKIINCDTCLADFCFTEEKQFVYKQRGWKPPRTCFACSGKRYSSREVLVGGKR